MLLKPVHVLVGIATFLLGSVLALVSLPNLEGELPSSDAVSIPLEEAGEPKAASLAFENFGGIACGSDGGTPASWTRIRSSDGIVIESTLLMFQTESAAQRKLRKISASALRVLESKPYTNYWNVKIGEKLLIEKESEFVLVTYTPAESSFNINILTSRSLDHLREFDKQSESLRRSFEINRLNP